MWWYTVPFFPPSTPSFPRPHPAALLAGDLFFSFFLLFFIPGNLESRLFNVKVDFVVYFALFPSFHNEI